jgi:hypothetical protein
MLRWIHSNGTGRIIAVEVFLDCLCVFADVAEVDGLTAFGE